MSNELKVTGGEWRAESFSGGWVIYNDADELVETVYSGEANAHLLAASKKLYEALVLLQHEMIESGNAGSEDFGWSAAIEKTREALAAARGEDQ